jgi:hypothetical protein
MKRATLILALAASTGCYGASNSEDGGAGSSSGGSSSGGSASGGAATGGSSSGGSSSGGSSSGGLWSGGASSGGAPQCDSSYLTTVDKSCDSVDDCVLVGHTSSCCGDLLQLAVNADAAAAFNEAESKCSALLPLCGCAAQGVSAEDGTLVSFGDTNIVADCTDNTCNSRYGGVTFGCSGKLCTEEQYCTITTGGPAGSEPYGNCNFLGGCSDCTCLDYTACSCTDQDGQLTVTCQAP